MRRAGVREKNMFTYSLKVALRNERRFWGPGLARLMLLVDESHSLNEAAHTMGMAYSKAWRVIKNAEKELGFSLLRRRVGGADGGGSEVTPECRRLVSQYLKFEQQLEQTAQQLFAECFSCDSEDGGEQYAIES